MEYSSIRNNDSRNYIKKTSRPLFRSMKDDLWQNMYTNSTKATTTASDKRTILPFQYPNFTFSMVRRKLGSFLLDRTIHGVKHAIFLSSFLSLYTASTCTAESLIDGNISSRGHNGPRIISNFTGGFVAGSFAGILSGKSLNGLVWGAGLGCVSCLASIVN